MLTKKTTSPRGFRAWYNEQIGGLNTNFRAAELCVVQAGEAFAVGFLAEEEELLLEIFGGHAGGMEGGELGIDDGFAGLLGFFKSGVFALRVFAVFVLVVGVIDDADGKGLKRRTWFTFRLSESWNVNLICFFCRSRPAKKSACG